MCLPTSSQGIGRSRNTPQELFRGTPALRSGNASPPQTPVTGGPRADVTILSAARPHQSRNDHVAAAAPVVATSLPPAQVRAQADGGIASSPPLPRRKPATVPANPRSTTRLAGSPVPGPARTAGVPSGGILLRPPVERRKNLRPQPKGGTDSFLSESPSFPKVSHSGSRQKPLRPPVKPVDAREETFTQLPLSGRQAILSDAKAFAQEQRNKKKQSIYPKFRSPTARRFKAQIEADIKRYDQLIRLIDDVENGQGNVGHLKRYEDIFARNGKLSPIERSEWIRERVDDLRKKAEKRLPELERQLKQFDEDSNKLTLPFPTKDSAITRTDRIAKVAKIELAKADLVIARKIENGEMSTAQFTSWQAAKNSFVREAFLIVPDLINLASLVANPVGDRDDFLHSLAHRIRNKIESTFPEDKARQHEFFQKAAVFGGTIAGNAGPNAVIGKFLIKKSIPVMEKTLLRLFIGLTFGKVQSYSREEMSEDDIRKSSPFSGD